MNDRLDRVNCNKVMRKAFEVVDMFITLVVVLSLGLYVWHSLFTCTPAAAAKLLQSCPTLCDPIDGSPQGSSVPGILQARTLERVAISFSNAWKWKVKGKSLSRVRLLATPCTAAYQAPPSWDFPGKSTGVGSCTPKYMQFFLYVNYTSMEL